MLTGREGAYAKHHLSLTICFLFWHGGRARVFLIVLSGHCHPVPEGLTVAQELVD